MRTFHFITICAAWACTGALLLMSLATRGSGLGTLVLCAAANVVSSIIYRDGDTSGR